jgi:hypothetical protein
MGEAELTTPRSEATPPREVETDAKQPKSHAKKQSYELAQGEGDADPDWVEIDHGVADQLVLVNEVRANLGRAHHHADTKMLQFFQCMQYDIISHLLVLVEFASGRCTAAESPKGSGIA